MTKVRVFKKEDGSVIYSFPHKMYQGGTFVDGRELTFADCRFGEAANLPFVDVDEADLPKSDAATGDHHEKIYFDGDATKENLKSDTEWSVRLMPAFLVRQKLRDRNNTALLTEYEKETPDQAVIQAVAKEVFIAGTKGLDDELFWAEKALEGLERADKEKPVIEEKLKEKIEEIKMYQGGANEPD